MTWKTHHQSSLGLSGLSEGRAGTESQAPSHPSPPATAAPAPQKRRRVQPGVRGDGPSWGSVSPSASAEETKVKSPLVGEYAGGGPGGCISRPLRAGDRRGGCGCTQASRRQPAHAPHGAARDSGSAGWQRGRRAAVPRDGPSEVLSVATAQTPRRPSPDRTKTVTAPLGLALCNVLPHWLPERGFDWVSLLLIPEVSARWEVNF